MTRALIILAAKTDRLRALRWIEAAPVNTRVEFKEPKRSLPQNDRMWAMLTDLARQHSYHGLRLTADDWKLLFLDALKREVRMVPNLDGNGFVSLGRSSSDLSKAEMSDLMEIIAEYGARNGVVFSEPVSSAARAPATAKNGAGEAVSA
jgi:hypothetical protein